MQKTASIAKWQCGHALTLGATTSNGKWLLKIATNFYCFLRFPQDMALEVKPNLPSFVFFLLQAFCKWDSLNFPKSM